MSKLITSSSHGKGRTCLTFSKDGVRAFTGGQDCIVRIWKVNEGADQEPATAVESDGAVTCVATADDCWFSGSEDTEVRQYAKDSTQFDGILTSLAGVSVRSIAIDPKGRRVAVTSEETFVKVVDMEDTMKVDRLEGYTRGVRSATWHPSGTLLATCTDDGKIVIWNMAAQQPVIEKTIENIIPEVLDTTSPESLYDCSVVWHTSGDYFFVATKGHEIVTVSRTDWTKSSTYSDKSASGSITALGLSSNGVYLVSASSSRVHIWSTQNRRLISTQNGTPGSTITHVAFSPRENLVAWTDTDGVFTRWPKAVSDNYPDPVKVTGVTTGPATIPVKPSRGLDLFVDKPQDTLNNVFGDDDGGDDSDADMPPDDWIVDDMDGALHLPDAGTTTKDGFVKEMVSITKAQPAFQPGSTPMENKKRYLAYNMIGVIEITDQDTHNIVNVEFHNKSLRKGYHFQDNFKYDMGYLGERGAVFACQPENDHSAEVVFKPYLTWKTNDWTYSLPRKGTLCLGIAAGGLPLDSRNSNDFELQGYGHVVVATSENDLTFLSGTGRERRIMALGADFVTMVASAEWVFVVHRAGSTTIDGSQNLSYSIINFEDFTVRQRDVLPVPKGHTLKWIGLTDLGAPVMYDTTGCVHILTKYRVPHHASWARVMDTNLLERRQGKDESYWPIGVTESTFVCVILKGRQEHPGFPRPLMQELPMKIPFRREEAGHEFIERELLLVQTLLDRLDEELTTDDIVAREKALDKEMIKLIQAACKENNVARAIELTKLLHNTASVDSAMQIAEFYHLVGLREKFGRLKADREDAEDRLIVARNKRRRWMKPDAPLREVAPPPTASSARFDPLGDTRPPPVIERPGMARVTRPIIENTRYSSLAPPSTPALVTPPALEPSSSTWDDSVMGDSPPPPETKRKRPEVDVDESSFPSSDFTVMPPPPKQKSNPFARKPTGETNKNPFARKAEPNRTIHKSDSFFDKVEVAEADSISSRKRPAAAKAKDKKPVGSGAKQTTLFGMLPKAEKQVKAKKPAAAPEPAPEPESLLSEFETQTDDITMSDAGISLETQETQETQEDTQPEEVIVSARAYSPEWEETQMNEDVVEA